MAGSPYAINASGAADSDYTISYIAGSLTVTADRTTTTISSSASTASLGASVTFTVVVTNNDSITTPLGSVVLTDGSTNLGTASPASSTANSATWTFTTSSLAAGVHQITAAYSQAPAASNPDFQSSNSPALSQTIGGGSSTTTTAATLAASSIDFGQATTITATVKSGGAAVSSGSVDFRDSTTGNDLGSVALNSSGVATLTTSVPLPAGAQAIIAAYSGASGFNASSASVSETVLPSIYLLNTAAGGSLNLSGSSTITISGLVQVDSSSLSAIQETGATKTTASAIHVVGGYSVSGSSGFSTTPVKGVASVSDPLASLPIPAATGLTSFGAINIGGVTSQTINPGIYSAINVSASATLKMNPGIYVITGGGFSVTGAASVSGSGVMIYNAGSNYNGGSGSTFGGFTLGGSGAVNLSPPTSGPYAGIVLFQSRDNTRALSLSGATVAALNGGVLYAPAALLNVSGSAHVGSSSQPSSSLIVNELLCSGTGSSSLGAGGAAVSDSDTAGQLLAGDVAVYVDNSSNAFTPDELARIDDAVASSDATVAPYGVHVAETDNPAWATTVITMSDTSPAGDASDGVLGCETPTGVTIVSGWNWYTGANPAMVEADQYDFETIVLHELGHALGLGHSQDPDSVMFATLDIGVAKGDLTDADLDIPDSDSGPCALHAASRTGLASNSVANNPTAPTGLLIALPPGCAGRIRVCESILGMEEPGQQPPPRRFAETYDESV